MASSSLFVWYLSSLILSATSQYANLCLWNRYLLNGRPTNGLYRRSTVQVNGKWYYKMDRSGEECAGKYYYIFWYTDAPHTGWYVGYGSTQSFEFGIQSQTVAKCITSGSPQTPVDCGNNWLYRDPYNSSDPYMTLDASVSASWGACPQLNCASIAITNNGIGTCFGTAHQTGSNQYTSADDSWIWYFNQPFFQWICVAKSAAIKSDSCAGQNTDTGLLNFAPTQTWQDLSAGQSITYDDSQGQTGTFSCTGTGTTTTFAPTVTFPTLPDVPTVAPTTIPTIDPTYKPTINPTINPTVVPTIDPNVDPTNAPSLPPTIAPSVSPTQPPTHAPTPECPNLSVTIVDTGSLPFDKALFEGLYVFKHYVSITNRPLFEVPQMKYDKNIQYHGNASGSWIIEGEEAGELSYGPTDLIYPPYGAQSGPWSHNQHAGSYDVLILCVSSFAPVAAPTHSPNVPPTNTPSYSPTIAPTHSPSKIPSNAPSVSPTATPSAPPTTAPSVAPTHAPSLAPTHSPTSFCRTLSVSVVELDGITLNVPSVWDGIYRLEVENGTSYGLHDWIGYDHNDGDASDASGGWIKYIGQHWILLSGYNLDTLSYKRVNDVDNYPPIAIATWTHFASSNNTALVDIKCSATFEPTTNPTESPSMAPTGAHTNNYLGVFVDDASATNDVYNNWFYANTSVHNQHARYIYYIDPFFSELLYDTQCGWQIQTRKGTNTKKIYCSDRHGLNPPLNEWIFFNITASNNIKVYITGLLSWYPTSDPSSTPIVPPTKTPIISTKTPSVSPIVQSTETHSAATTDAPLPQKQLETLLFMCRYTDDKELVTTYLSLSQYAQIMTDAILYAVQMETDYNLESYLNITICKVFNDNLRNLNINCSLPACVKHVIADSDEYIAVGTFTTLNLNLYQDWIVDISSDDFRNTFTQMMNHEISTDLTLDYDMFNANEINIMDALYCSMLTTEIEEQFDDKETSKRATRTIVIIAAVLFVVLVVVIAVSAKIYNDKKERESNHDAQNNQQVGNIEIEGLFTQNKDALNDMNEGNEGNEGNDDDIIKQVNTVHIGEEMHDEEDDIISAINETHQANEVM